MLQFRGETHDAQGELTFARHAGSGAGVPPPAYIVLCGLPGAGKSTFRSEIVDYWLAPKPAIVSSDDYIEAYARVRSLTYSEVFDEAVKEATAFISRKRSAALSERRSVIHDQTNLSSKKRSALLADLPPGYARVALYAECDEGERQRRTANRPGKVIPVGVDRVMQGQWQRPCLAEGFDIVAPSRMWWQVLAPWVFI